MPPHKDPTRAIRNVMSESSFFKTYCAVHPEFKSQCALFWSSHRGMERGDALRDFRHAFPEYHRERKAYDKKMKRLRKQQTFQPNQVPLFD